MSILAYFWKKKKNHQTHNSCAKIYKENLFFSYKITPYISRNQNFQPSKLVQCNWVYEHRPPKALWRDFIYLPIWLWGCFYMLIYGYHFTYIKNKTAKRSEREKRETLETKSRPQDLKNENKKPIFEKLNELKIHWELHKLH